MTTRYMSPEQVEDCIQRPPRNFQKMFKKYGNNHLDIINENRVHFFVSYGIKKHWNKTRLPIRKLKSYNMFDQRINCFHQFETSDHIEAFETHDGTLVLVSSPYKPVPNHMERHKEFGFKQFDKPLYNNNANSFVLVCS